MNLKRPSISVLVFGTVGAICLMLALAWGFRAPLVEAILHSRLAALGFSGAVGEVKSVSPWRADIRNAQLTKNTRIKKIEAEIEWLSPVRPRLSKLILSGISLELGITRSGVDWKELNSLIKNLASEKTVPKYGELPVVEVRGSSAKIHIFGESTVALISGVSFSLMPGESKGTWAVGFNIKALRHLAAIPAISPFGIEGVGELSHHALTIGVRLRQPKSGLNGKITLYRDNKSGEGNATIDFAPLRFRKDGLAIGDVSPYLARYVGSLNGGIKAVGKISFNDAWATPFEITGNFNGLVVGFDQSFLKTTKGELEADLANSTFKISLPPASPDKSRLNIEVTDGGLRLGPMQVDGLTGDIRLNSLSPVTCRQDQETPPAETNMDRGANMVADCTLGALTPANSKQSLKPFHAAVIEIARNFSSTQP